MSDHQEDPGRGPTFVGVPCSRLGWCSVGLAAAWLVLFGLWWFYVTSWRPIARPTFFSDPLHACLILAAAAAGIGGAVAGVLALAVKRERSVLIVLSILLGAFVLYWTIANLINPNP